jgi:hypothetical protein
VIIRTLHLLELIYADSFPVIISLRPSSTSLAPTSIQDCHAIVGFQGAASQVLMMAVQAILLLRGVCDFRAGELIYVHSPCFEVGALYQRKAFLQLTLRALYVAEIITMTVIFIIAMPQVEYGIHCVVTYFPPKYSTPFLWAAPFFSDCYILLTLRFLKPASYHDRVSFVCPHDGKILRSCTRRLGSPTTHFSISSRWCLGLCTSLRFVFPTLFERSILLKAVLILYIVILTINTACMALLPGSLSSIAYSCVFPISL